MRVLSRWLDRHERIDELMNALPAELDALERARCQHLVFGVVRHAGRLEAALDRLVAHPPRFVTRAMLYLAGFELIEGTEPGAAAKIVHHAVEHAKTLASPAEARLINAVGRKLAAALAAEVPPGKLASADALATYFSHPPWLVRRWLTVLGAAPTRSLLEWNQRPGAVFVRWRARDTAPPAFLLPTPWADFFEVPTGQWRELDAEREAGRCYVQDPSTRLAVDALSPSAGETVFDGCAAPGGKTIAIADRLLSGRVVAVDDAGLTEEDRVRHRRLEDNVRRYRLPDVRIDVLAADLLAPGMPALLEQRGLPASYAGVLLDVPCSNTGVMRHRVDVKWRLQEADFGRHARQQGRLLAAAARLVAPGGRLVYSTCSVDPEENGQVVAAFLRSQPDFRLAGSAGATPWEQNHDGAGVHVLRRAGP